MKKDYTFISLSEAYRKISHDWLRLKKYAVLTFDDGYASILPSLEWLKEQQISYSLFLNAKYLDGYSCSAHILDLSKESEKSASTEGTVKGLYFTVENLNALPNDLSEFGSHGFEHIDSTALSPSSFIEQIGKCLEVINRWPQSIPFHAYTWGRHSASTDKILHDMGIIPVLMDGGKNYNDASCIHREEFPKP